MFNNKWFQCLVIIVGVSILRVLIAGILDVPILPAENLVRLIQARNWAGGIYFLIYDLGTIIKGAYILRAVGLVEFL